MAPTAKPSEARRKSGGKPTLLVSLTVAPDRLRELIGSTVAKKETPSPESKPEASPSTSGILDATPNNGETASDSNAATPAQDGTPGPSSMAPPAEKKKGVKRSAPAANGSNDGIPKPRGKPGPKKKPRLEDGTIDAAGAASRAAAGHKLGPKANQGAINAGLRALDRSGKPCRKWNRGGFTLKSFTGTVWEIPRWTAPQKKGPDSNADDSAAPSVDNTSSKENKANGQDANSGDNSGLNSNNGGDVEMQSMASVNASSPAPMPVAAAS